MTSCPACSSASASSLVDFKLEFGRFYENDMMRIVLADEISPDNCRLWDVDTKDKMDKDRFRRDMGGLVEAYHEVADVLASSSRTKRQNGRSRNW